VRFAIFRADATSVPPSLTSHLPARTPTPLTPRESASEIDWPDWLQTQLKPSLQRTRGDLSSALADIDDGDTTQRLLDILERRVARLSEHVQLLPSETTVPTNSGSSEATSAVDLPLESWFMTDLIRETTLRYVEFNQRAERSVRRSLVALEDIEQILEFNLQPDDRSTTPPLPTDSPTSSPDKLADLGLEHAARRVSGFHLEFQPPSFSLLDQLGAPFETTDAIRRPREAFFERLHQMSRGNPMLGLLYWLQSVRRDKTDETQFLIDPLPDRELDLLEPLVLLLQQVSAETWLTPSVAVAVIIFGLLIGWTCHKLAGATGMHRFRAPVRTVELLSLSTATFVANFALFYAVSDTWLPLGLATLTAIIWATSPILRNVTAGIAIAADNDLEVGDTVELSASEGVVRRFDLQAVHIRSHDGRHYAIPNSTFLEEPLYTDVGDDESACTIEVPFPDDIDPETAKSLAREAAAMTPLASPNHKPEVFITTDAARDRRSSGTETSARPFVHIRGFASQPQYRDRYRGEVLSRLIPALKDESDSQYQARQRDSTPPE